MNFEISLTSRYPTIYARLHGKNGTVREYRALIDTTTDYCVLPRVDAYRLGYPEAAHDDPVTRPSNLVMLASSIGYPEGMMIMMQQVEIGDLKIDGVQFISFDLPQVIGFDVVLGRNLFLRGSLSIEFDYQLAKLRISQKSKSG